MSAPKTTVVYHKNCVDGVVAAWAAWLKLPHATFLPAEYGDAPPVLERGEILYVLDFSYPIAELRELCKVAELVIVVDHHKTTEKLYIDLGRERGQAIVRANYAEEYDEPMVGPTPNEVWPPNLKLVVDIYESGAQLTWKFIHGPNTETPELIELVGDADLFKFRDPRSKAFTRLLGSYMPLLPNQVGAFHTENLDDWVTRGHSLLRGDVALLDWIQDETRREFNICLDGDEEQGVPAINVAHAPMFNCPKPMYSALNDRFTREHDVVVSYFDTAEYRSFRFNSDRNNPDSFDCEALAVRLGGGGHKNSASCKVPRDHWLAKI